jgi:transposase-like protein
MGTELTVPQTLREAIIYYADPKVCVELMVAIRWPDGVVCPHCESKNVKYMDSVQRFKCYGCRKQFSVKVGTILEDSPISLSQWLPAFWLLTSAKNGISSYELSRSLGVTQKTAWFMLHRIRHILKTGTFTRLEGTCEADETFIGGKAKNMQRPNASAKFKVAARSAKRSSWVFLSAAKPTPISTATRRKRRARSKRL